MEEVPTDLEELEEMASDVNVDDSLKEELKDLDVEAVVLGRSQSGKNKYRNLESDEIAPALKPFQVD